MYKVFTSLWSSTLNSSTRDETKPINAKKDDDWVLISKTIGEEDRTENENPMEISWIKSDEQQIPLARLNPIENLLIEHASMSVYEDIASKSRSDDSPIRDVKLDEQTEEDEEDEDLPTQNPNSNSIHNRLLIDSNTLDSSTTSLLAHHRHLTRFHQRRKRPPKSPLLQSPMNIITDRTTRLTPTTRSLNNKFFSPVLRST